MTWTGEFATTLDQLELMNSTLLRSLLFAAVIAVLTPLPDAFGQGTAFTYQGFLTSQGAPANGSYDFQFAIFDAASGGTQQGATFNTNGLGVTNGLFTATIDPGANVFTGGARWLLVSTRPTGHPTFTSLLPLQPITASPYAVFAGSAGILKGNISPAQLPTSVVTNRATNLTLSGSFTGNGGGLTNVNAAMLGGLGATGFWKTNGNAGANPTNGAFLGTTDNLPLELRVNNARALRLEPTTGTPNVIGGYGGNWVSNGVVGGFIGGGGDSTYPNIVGGVYASVLGGRNNIASGQESTAMGSGNKATGTYSIAMGASTTGSGYGSTAMGYGTTASGDLSTAMGDSTVASGVNSTAAGQFATASGVNSTAMGFNTTASGAAAVAMGAGARAVHDRTFVWADSGLDPMQSTAPGQFIIRAGGGVGINTNDPKGAALAVNGDATSSGNISFGSTTRQMLNLWSTNYGIGVQSASLYFRCNNGGANDGFIWYMGGTHNDAYANPGGGVELMHLIKGALYVNGTLASTSDRNVKENFAPVNPADVLEKVVSLPITRWNYKNDTATSHLGPVAQDFYAAFGVGPDDKHITTVDESGVALAAIQGLNEKVEVRNQRSESTLQELRAENAALKARLERLEKLLSTQREK